ncbi:hypothetical protein EP073_12200 [Geovibrio thiophilus]|uniref:Uncharacterized protein n=1 Tax=Geovibrio thiophilus TaxID=139438 RepID=A0A3R5XY69_9BACT|nr:hypothetical protein [Geovibrio thiophilus]QAR34137.1 hypothetical protein EP073_12200 [Geovibrio thiophilus]
MKKIITFCAVCVLFFSVGAFADVRFENRTELLLGVRVQSQSNRNENYVLVKPKQSVSMKNTGGGLSISAQLITGSYEINCCEWFTVPDGKSLIVRLADKNSESCFCVSR